MTRLFVTFFIFNKWQHMIWPQNMGMTTTYHDFILVCLYTRKVQELYRNAVSISEKDTIYCCANALWWLRDHSGSNFDRKLSCMSSLKSHLEWNQGLLRDSPLTYPQSHTLYTANKTVRMFWPRKAVMQTLPQYFCTQISSHLNFVCTSIVTYHSLIYVPSSADCNFGQRAA